MSATAMKRMNRVSVALASLVLALVGTALVTGLLDPLTQPGVREFHRLNTALEALLYQPIP